MGARSRLWAWRLRRTESDAGFGLLEVVIASGVMLTALTSMAYVTTNSFYDIAGAKQRQTAVAIADEALEQVRALPYATLELGNRTADLAGDPRVLGLGTSASPYRLATTNERIVASPTNQTVAPLVPNVSSRTVDQVVYVVRLYVSLLQDAHTGAYTATAYVDWAGGRGNQAHFVRATTVIFSPSAATQGIGGAGSGSCIWYLQPFAGLCPASFTASAKADAGDMTTSGSGSTGLALSGATSDLPVVTSVMSVAGASVIGGTGTGGGITLADTKYGYTTSTTNADDDPSTVGVNPYESDDSPNAGAISASTPAGLGAISMTGTSGDTSESVSAVSPSPTLPNVCRDPVGAIQTDGRPCGRSRAFHASTLTTTYDVLGIGLGTVTVAEALAPATNAVAYTKHYRSAASGPCAGTSETGCVHAFATRKYDKVRIGGLPSTAIVPLGFLGYLAEISAYEDSVSVEAGIRAGPPNTTTSGTMKYWDGTGYSTVAVVPGPSTSIVTASVTVSVGLYTVQVTAPISIGPSTSTSTTATCLGALALPCRTYAHATIGPPMYGTLTYSFRLLGVEVYRLTSDIDLGSLTATASYTDPP